MPDEADRVFDTLDKVRTVVQVYSWIPDAGISFEFAAAVDDAAAGGEDDVDGDPGVRGCHDDQWHVAQNLS